MAQDSLKINLENNQIQETLSKIGITTRLPNGSLKSFNEVMIDLSNMFKKLQSENKTNKKEILNKFYSWNEDGTQSQIYCLERDSLENKIANNNILMKYTCYKLGGIRKSNELYLILTSMRLRKRKNKTQ